MYANYKRKTPKVLSGNGKNWSNVSNGIEHNFLDWLSCSELSENEFSELIKANRFEIKRTECLDNGEYVKAIFLIADNNILGKPFYYKEQKNYSYDEFETDVVLLLFYISGRYLSSELEKALREFVVAFGNNKE